MDEEIKEILDRIKKHYVLDEEQDIILLNYITNLQEENQKLKELCDKYEEEHNSAFKLWTMKMEEMPDYEERMKLKQENQKLVKVIEELENYLKVGIAMNYNMNNDKLSEQTVDNYTDILNKLTELKGGSDD